MKQKWTDRRGLFTLCFIRSVSPSRHRLVTLSYLSSRPSYTLCPLPVSFASTIMSDPSQPTESTEDPRSPRPSQTPATGNTTDNNAPTAPPPPIFIDAIPSATAAQYQRASSLQSLLMLTFFFFFFSGGNNSPLGDMSGESDAKGKISRTIMHMSGSLTL